MLVDLIKYYLISIVLQNRQKCCYNGFLYQHYEVEDFEMLIRYCNSALAAMLLIFAFNGNVLADSWEVYIGGGMAYVDSDCDSNRTYQATIPNPNFSWTTRVTETAGSCDEEVGYQVHAGADYVFDGFLLGVEIGYIDVDLDFSGRGAIAFVQNNGDNLDNPVFTDNLTGGGDVESSSFFYGVRFGGSFMDDRLSPYLRLGLHRYDFERTTRATGNPSGVAYPTLVYSDDGTDLYYGVGIEYDVWKEDNHGFGLRLDYTIYDVDQYGDSKILALTGQYEFGILN